MPRGSVRASSLRLRSGPSTGHEIISSIPRGTRVEILGHDGVWLHVRADTQEGFVHGDFVRVLPEEGAAAAAFFREDPSLAELETEPAASLPGKAANQAEKKIVKLWENFGGLLDALAQRLDVPVGLCVAVLRVESGGAGFRKGRLLIRFENHVFWSKWGKSQPNDFRAHYKFNPDERWKGHRFRASRNEPWGKFHGDQDKEWNVLDFSRKLEDEAALSSISMGAPQIMGFNHGRVGYASARELFEAFSASERAQIVGLFDFIRGPEGTSEMAVALQRGDLEGFATGYNGKGQAARYAGLIDAEFERFRKLAGA